MLCKCGCGVEAGIADRSDPARMVKRGDPRQFVKGHQGGTDKRHGMSHSPTHRTWVQMRARCQRPSSDGWQAYGGRGIRVCERWESFENFLADMGHRPPGMTLDRLDVNGDYSKANCRWASATQQASNRRNNRLFTLDGVTLTQSQLCRNFGINWCTVRDRLSRGWTVEDAFKRPTDPLRRRKH